MIGDIITYTFKTKEGRDSFIREAKKAHIEEECLKENGCIRYEYVITTKDDTSMYLIEFWENEESKKPHHNTAHFLYAMELKKKYCCESTNREKIKFEHI